MSPWDILGPMKTYVYTFIFSLFLVAFGTSEALSIQTSNRILVKVAETPITVLDVKREMDRQIYMNDQRIFENPQATYTHYMKNWKHVLQKIVQDEILYLEAKKMEYKIPSHDITQKVAELYGDNSVETCRMLSMTAEQAREHCNKEVISTHLSWYKIWNKSIMAATPKMTNIAYADHVADLAKKDQWTYQTIYVKGKDEKEVLNISDEVATMLKESDCENISGLLHGIGAGHEDLHLRASKDITLHTNELSSSLLSTLGSLEEGMTSEVITNQKGEEYIAKILRLKSIQKEPIPPYEELAENLRNGLINKFGSENTTMFFEDLYKQYDIDGLYGEKLTASTLQPFSIQND